MVEHVGRRTIVLSRPDGELVYVTEDTSGLMPGGVSLHAGAWEGIAARLRRHPLAQPLGNDWLEPALPPATDLGVAAGGVQPVQVERLHALLEASAGPEQGPVQGADAPTLALRLVATSVEALPDLVGVGPGTTPRGDDVTLGVLLGWQLAGRSADVASLRASLPPLLALTTTASRHFLGWAIRGAFASPVRDLALALQGHGELEAVFRRLTAWGASSGLDVAHGVRAALTVGISARQGLAA